MTETVIEALQRNSGNPKAVIDPGRTSLSSGELIEGAERIAGQLATLGIGPNATTASVLPNGVAAAQVYLGAIAAGRAAPLNPKLTPRELIEQLAGVDARVIVTTPERVTALADLPIDVVVVAVEPAASGFELHDDRGRVSLGAPEGAVGSDGALALLTSGTTGAPKRVSLSHSNLLHAVDGITSTLGLNEDDCGLLLMPQFHIHGLQAGLLAPLMAGGRVVIPDGFDAFSVPRLCAVHAVTWYTGVPVMHGLIVERAARQDHEWAGQIRFTRSSSAAMPPALHERTEAMLGAPLIEAYGMTECAHQIASNQLPPADRVVGSVGTATGVEIRIADEREDGAGEVLVRGASVTTGYEAVEPDVNARAFSQGWLHTGDEGRLDAAGRLTLTGRLKEIINRGGEKVRPQEVEAVIASHPGVREVAVFAVPHPRLGEDVAAAVVLANSRPSLRELRDHAGRDLATFKVPKTIRFVDDIPRGPTGKIQRSTLAAQLDMI